MAPLALSIPLPAGTDRSAPLLSRRGLSQRRHPGQPPWARTTSATAVSGRPTRSSQRAGAQRAAVGDALQLPDRRERARRARTPSRSALPPFLRPLRTDHRLAEQSRPSTPSVCDSDGICDRGRDLRELSGDCDCAGRRLRAAAGTPRARRVRRIDICFADCGQPLAAETPVRGRASTGTATGRSTAFDTDCCCGRACDGFDIDGDGLAAACDAATADASILDSAREASELHVFHYGRRSTRPCLGAAGGSRRDRGGRLRRHRARRGSGRGSTPGPGRLRESGDDDHDGLHRSGSGSEFFYLVRARNGCPREPVRWDPAPRERRTRLPPARSSVLNGGRRPVAETRHRPRGLVTSSRGPCLTTLPGTRARPFAGGDRNGPGRNRSG
jgi:hypothetical protein